MIVMGMMFFISCDKTDLPLTEECSEEIIIDTDYAAVSDDFTFVDVSIDGNCFKATVRYGGGCNEEEVAFSLLASTGAFPVTLPPMLGMKLVLEDNDSCEALVTREVSFDLSPLEDAGFNNLNVSLENWNDVLQYQF